MAKLCFDYGHGGQDPGAVYNGRLEKDDVLRLGLAVAKEVRRHGVVVDETRTTDRHVSLSERSNMELRGAYDFFISFHRNAFRPEAAQGVETYTYIQQTAKAKSLATRIQNNLVAIGFVNRGVKKADFHVLRETRAPALLIEVGFIDNSGDNHLFDANFDRIVSGIASAILEEVGITYGQAPAPAPPPDPAPPPTSDTFYRVMAGSFKERKNANAQVDRLKKAGFDATIMIFKP